MRVSIAVLPKIRARRCGLMTTCFENNRAAAGRASACRMTCSGTAVASPVSLAGATICLPLIAKRNDYKIG